MTSVLGINLPSHWSATPLKHATKVLNRGSTPDYVDSGAVRVISQASNQAGGLHWERTRFHNFGGSPSTLKGYLRQDDMLINSTGTGTLGRIGYFTGSPDGLPCMADSHVTIARADHEKLDPRFAYYWLTSHPFQDYIYAALVVGATNQIELNRDRLGNAPVPLPSLSEQRHIAEFLDAEAGRIDSILRARTEQLGLLKDRRAALKTQSVTYSGANAVSHPILGSINPEWQVVPLRRALPAINVGVVINPSHFFTDSGVPFIHGFNVREGFISTTGMKHMTTESNEAHRRSKVYTGDVLVVRAGATAGRASAVGDEFNGANCASVLILRQSEKIHPKYLETFINAVPGKGQVSFSQYGAAQEVISAGQVGSFLMAVPPLQEQVNRLTKLAAATARTVALEEKLQRQVQLLQERRQALITAAVTGQFDVATASGRNATEGVST
ncbi:restriction endonuclease subunit S [Streptomyces sp. NPDC021139]|uniref:restriction endonuclease subunit S n=1 Tax=unclassified Streptomyces TaxID=2593676 RepID=UPI0034045594